MDKCWSFTGNIRHWVLGVEAHPNEVAIRFVWFTLIIQRKGVAV